MTEEGIDARSRVLLDSLLRAVGPSSYERPAAEIWREAAGASTANQSTPSSTAVRQQPEQAMEAPSAIPSTG